MHKQRKSYRVLAHIDEHLTNAREAGSRGEEIAHIDLAHNMVKEALKQEKQSRRRGD